MIYNCQQSLERCKDICGGELAIKGPARRRANIAGSLAVGAAVLLVIY